MSVKASPEIIREMEKELGDTVRRLDTISNGIRNVVGKLSTEGWDDQQAAEFQRIMYRISDLVVQPVDALKEAMPKLENLAQILDRYQSIKFY